MQFVLEVRDLRVDYVSDGLPSARVLRGITLNVAEHEGLGILGESGCGKTTFALALLRLLPDSATVREGSICLMGRDLLQFTEREMEKLRGAQLSIVFQDPSSALHPVRRVGVQLIDVIGAHRPDLSREQRRELSEATLKEVGLADTERIFSSYPHELSGGQRQRVVIAQALVCRPGLLVADEPTSSLDATVQAEILALLNRLRRERRLSLIFISHNPAVISEVADRVVVLYAGQIVEEGSAREVLASPLHPFTQALLSCLGTDKGLNKVSRATPLPGAPPDPAKTPLGCAFAPRCKDRMAECERQMPAEVCAQPGRHVRCFKYGG